MENENTHFCLSGKSKPFSNKKREVNSTVEIKPKDIFSKLRGSSKTEINPINNERPRTAIRKSSATAPIHQSNPRPASANLNRSKTKSKFRFPSLKSTQSIDSAVGSQLSSSDDDTKTSDDDDDKDDKDESSTSASEDEEESSDDSGIIKVRVVSRNTNDSRTSTSTPSRSPTTKSILVKEFNRTPDVTENDTMADAETIECEEFTDTDEDEESKAEPLLSSRFQNNTENITDEVIEENANDRDVILMELGPNDSSEIIINQQKNELAQEFIDEQNTLDNDLIVTDIEANEEIIDKITDQCTGVGEELEVPQDKSCTEKFTNASNISSHNLSESANDRAPYDPILYKNCNNGNNDQPNSSLIQLVNSNEQETNQTESYENLIKSTIEKLEIEEKEVVTQNNLDDNQVVKVENNHESDRLSTEELEKLKKKCLNRMRDHQTAPLVVNPPVIKDFSNSQKLLNFLDETEEKDKTILNSVKRSSYNLQVRIW